MNFDLRYCPNQNLSPESPVQARDAALHMQSAYGESAREAESEYTCLLGTYTKIIASPQRNCGMHLLLIS